MYRPFRLPILNPTYHGTFMEGKNGTSLNGVFTFSLMEKSIWCFAYLYFAEQIVFGASSFGINDMPELQLLGGRLVPLIMLFASRLGIQIRWWMRQWDADAIIRILAEALKEEEGKRS